MKNYRFRNEKQILDAIDKNRLNAERSMKRAEEHEQSAKKLFKESWEVQQAGNHERADFLRKCGNTELEKSESTRKYATMLLGPRAKKLGDRLSEFRTATVIPLFGTKGIGDMSVEGI